MPERRKFIRSRVLKNAKLFLGASSVIDCVVQNLTPAGARVQISSTADLPERLTMTFDSGRTLRSCRIVWRALNETGLEFTRQG
jgi:methyl-accepting chemotaxis protein